MTDEEPPRRVWVEERYLEKLVELERQMDGLKKARVRAGKARWEGVSWSERRRLTREAGRASGRKRSRKEEPEE